MCIYSIHDIYRSTDLKYIKEQRSKNIKDKTKLLSNDITSSDIFLKSTRSSRERKNYIINNTIGSNNAYIT